MIRDARVLRAGFVPREVEHRDAKVNHLSSVLEPITSGEPADTAIVTGPSGAGKTCISQFVTERLREEVLDVETTYVNCWRNYTRFRTLYQILDDLGATIDIHRQSTPHDELVDRLQQHDGPRTVVILDEVDQLEDLSIIYDLHSLPQFAIICIANKEEELISRVDDFSLSRWPGVDYQQLASRSTYSSYGRVGHSPARYNVPGRAIVDESNTFFYGETNLDGVLDLVSRSKKPVQELAWASIGNVLTAIQICEAHGRRVLVPWNSWRHEFFKPMETLHDADRGGFIFAPEVGIHEDVHELDFSSLYPNIICTRNVSPDIIRCECHSDRDDVPGLGYSICDEQGYLVDVLQPIIDARDEIKAAIRREQQLDDPDERRLAELEGRSGALKWILVACFGYQGFSNAKFGRIECHEAINAYARELLLTAKQRLEAGGWRVVHGIVDSIWVTPDPDVDDDDREDLEALATEITEDVEIRLEHEARYDWVAFVPQRESNAGALTKYFGKVAGADEFKIRGIEARQRSTPPFIEAVQQECLERFDATRSPEAVLDRLQDAVTRLHAGTVPAKDLVERNRVSKPLERYTQNTQNVAALKRARDQDLAVHPGQDIEYVVVNDEKNSRERIALAHEEIETYDASYYETQLIRAVESVLSPLDWDRMDIQRELSESQMTDLGVFTEIDHD